MDKLPPTRPSPTTRLDVGSTVLPAGHSLRLQSNAPTKPSEGLLQTFKSTSTDLRARLSSFIPALAAANVDTQARIANEGQEALDPLAVKEGERHVEMSVAITELPEGAQDDAAEALEDATAEAAGSAGAAGSSRLGLRTGGTSGGRTGTSSTRPRIESMNDGGGAAAAAAGGGSSSSSSSSDSEDGEGAGTEEGEGRLPAGKWVTDPQALAQHRVAILNALIAQQAAQLRAEGEEAREDDEEDEEEDEDEGEEQEGGDRSEDEEA